MTPCFQLKHLTEVVYYLYGDDIGTVHVNLFSLSIWYSLNTAHT